MNRTRLRLLLPLAVMAVGACAPVGPSPLPPTEALANLTPTPDSRPVAILPITSPPPSVLSAPSPDAPPISSQPELGGAAPILGRDTSGEWWQVEVHGEVGWLLASAVEVEGDVSEVPIIPNP
jgi:hypothetical protein